MNSPIALNYKRAPAWNGGFLAVQPPMFMAPQYLRGFLKIIIHDVISKCSISICGIKSLWEYFP